MNFPQDLRYTASHEWVRLEADGSLTVGITDLAQDSLANWSMWNSLPWAEP